jgi:putative NADPH-quinone reductase
MKSENIYMVWTHPRADSLTAQVVQEIQGRAEHYGMKVATLDLYRSGFKPALNVEDEPDWDNPNKVYSPEVHRLFGELEGNDTLVMVFPLWWYQMPAMLKGYMDRVWNHGLAYGGKGLPVKKIRWVVLVGGSESGFEKFGWKSNMTDFFNGVGSYLGGKETEIDFLYNTVGVEEDIVDGHYQQLFAQVRGVVDELAGGR